VHNTAATQLDSKGSFSFGEMLIGPVMIAVTSDKEPVFTVIVKSTGAAWCRAKLTMAIGVHRCLQILHLTYLHLYRIHQ